MRTMKCAPLALLLAAALAACGGAPAATTTTTATAPATTASAATAVEATPAPTTAAAATTHTAVGSGYPVTIENCGRTLRFDKSPERVVVAYEALAEIMIALGLGSKIVGVQYGTAQEALPEQAAEVAKLPFLVEPGAGSASKEVLLSTNPDFVLVTYFAYDLGASAGAASEADYKTLGAQAYGMATEAPCLAEGETFSIETIYADIRDIGRIFGVPERTEALVQQMRERMDKVQQRIAGRPPVKMIFYEGGTGPLTVYGSGLANELARLAGGVNELADQGSYAQVGQEVIAAKEAEVWVITEYPGFDPVEQRAEFLYTTFPNMPASRNKRSVGLNGATAGVGIRLPDAVEVMARAFHPDAFTEGEPVLRELAADYKALNSISTTAGSSEERAAYLKKTFPNSTAVKNDRVLVLPYGYMNPRIQNAIGVEELAKLLSPETFR